PTTDESEGADQTRLAPGQRPQWHTPAASTHPTTHTSAAPQRTRRDKTNTPRSAHHHAALAHSNPALPLCWETSGKGAQRKSPAQHQLETAGLSSTKTLSSRYVTLPAAQTRTQFLQWAPQTAVSSPCIQKEKGSLK